MNFLNAIQQKSLTAKITTMSSILTIVVAVALNCMFVAHEKKRIYGALEQRGLSLAKATAHGASSYVVARDRTALMGLLRGIEMEEDVAYVIIQDARGNVMAQTETGLESQALNRTSGETIEAVDGIETSLWKPSGQSSIYNVTVLASSRVSSRFDDEPDVGTLAEPNGGARSAQFGPANAATARVGISTKAAGEAFARSIMLAAVLTVLLIGLSVVVAARTIRMILSPLRSLLSCVQTTGEGDLTTKFSAAASNDEVGKLSDAFDKMQESLKSVVQQIQSSAELVDSSVSELSSSSRQQAAGANEQSTSLTETSSAVEELAAVSKQIAENAKKVAETAEQSLERMETIRENTALGANRIFTLGEKSQSIGEVVSMIDDITRQTNLLALNASIEAARAGAAGKGFAVVATEIRKLATNVAGSTDQIREIIKEIQNATNASVLATENITKSVESGIEMSKMAAESASHINMATQQQKSASDQMVTTIKEMVAIAKQTSSGARQIAETANKLSDATMVQKKLVSLFKIQ